MKKKTTILISATIGASIVFLIMRGGTVEVEESFYHCEEGYKNVSGRTIDLTIYNTLWDAVKAGDMIPYHECKPSQYEWRTSWGSRERVISDRYRGLRIEE